MTSREYALSKLGSSYIHPMSKTELFTWLEEAFSAGYKQGYEDVMKWDKVTEIIDATVRRLKND